MIFKSYSIIIFKDVNESMFKKYVRIGNVIFKKYEL